MRWCSAVPRVPRPGIGPPPWPQVPSMAVERNFIVAILVVWCAAAGRENWASQGLTWKRRETYCMNAYASYLMRMQNIYCILYWIYVYMYIDVCNLLFSFSSPQCYCYMSERHILVRLPFPHESSIAAQCSAFEHQLKVQVLLQLTSFPTTLTTQQTGHTSYMYLPWNEHLKRCIDRYSRFLKGRFDCTLLVDCVVWVFLIIRPWKGGTPGTPADRCTL